jgi:sugar lactone lactonase YvrE
MKRFIFLIISFTLIIRITPCCTRQAAYTQQNPPGGLVTTLAGPSFEITNGTGSPASFNGPEGVAVDAAGNVYVADYANNMIRKISPSGVVTTLAGNLNSGSSNGMGTAASFNHPSGVAVDPAGNVYVADYGNNLIRAISSSGVVTTIAGNGSQGSSNGTGTAASFKSPSAVAVDAAGNLYVADEANNLIRKISPSGVVTTLAGPNFPGSSGSAGGPSGPASFSSPSGVAVDASGNVYVADYNNFLIRKINSSGVVTTFAGNGSQGSANGIGLAASFDYPSGLGIDASGNIYVTDQGNNLVRMISPSGTVTTLAGPNFPAPNGTAGYFNLPSGVAVDASGNVYVADYGNNLIRKITSSGVVSTLAGNGSVGSANTIASFEQPTGVAVDAAGNVYVADNGNNLIRMISPSGVVTTLAGNGVPGLNNGPDTAASFYYPTGVAVDDAGNVYVADFNNSSIRKITSAGAVSTFAGNGSRGSANGTAASFNNPFGIAVDASGNVYVADFGNNMIREITPAGLVSTLAGNLNSGSSNGTGVAASFNGPEGVAVDALGNVYVADEGNNMIRKISPSGVVTTLAGNVNSGSTNGMGTAASFFQPSGVAVDAAGNIYVADNGNNQIRKITSTGEVSTWAGSGSKGTANGRGYAASFTQPAGVAVDAAGNVYVADQYDNLIRKITP